MGTKQLLRTRIGCRAGAGFCAGAIALGSVAADATAAGASTAGAAHRSVGATPVVTIAEGAVRGKATGIADQFLGIPYAAPPVGELRWRPPQPAAPWRGERDATRFAPHCAQPATPFGSASSSEDCLYLNVFAPADRQHDDDDERPVIVWIHGGGFAVGESDDYDPAKLVADGTVVVTINYRLGALGFLAHPALAARPGGSSGAYGLMDQQAALRWVQRNIGAFGGDRRKVAIAGESAGGLSVLAHVASRGARGLFARAIVQSGAFLTQTPLEKAETAGQAFAAKVGCVSQTAACLRGLPLSTIQANDDPLLSGYTVVVDGKVLTQSIGTALASGQFNRVPMINGTTHDEGRLFTADSELQGAPVTAANYEAMIASTLGVSAAAATVVATQYPLSAYPSPALALSAVGTDAIFACPALTLDKLASKFVATFAYEFSDVNAPQRYLPPVSFPYGAAHASEIQYLFDVTAPIAGRLTAQQQGLADSMQDYWADFAARGVPSSAGQPRWPAFNSHSQMLSLVPPQPQVQTDFAAAHHCDFWAPAG
jgi:para-nitrobenzyl esterase